MLEKIVQYENEYVGNNCLINEKIRTYSINWSNCGFLTLFPETISPLVL